MPKSKSKIGKLGTIKTKIPGGASITKYFKRESKKTKKAKPNK